MRNPDPVDATDARLLLALVEHRLARLLERIAEPVGARHRPMPETRGEGAISLGTTVEMNVVGVGGRSEPAHVHLARIG